ncbi:MAG: LytTR family transcriptional regulator DNA-binding domain-containing protein [bacterium]|nr:LytTR family transcriptional regulator DNA-binding domain-containing protein [bacterium]
MSIKIVICSNNAEALVRRKAAVAKAAGALGMKLGLSVCCGSRDMNILSGLVGDRERGFDVYVLEGNNSDHAELAARLRERNALASIIFGVEGVRLPHPAMNRGMFRFRPSSLIADFSNAEQVREVLSYCCAEQRRCKPWLVLKIGRDIVKVRYEEIIYLLNQGRDTEIVRSGAPRLIYHQPLKELLPLLPEELFLHCHKSIAVNLKFIDNLDVGRHEFVLINGERLQISNSYYKEITTLYKLLCRNL